jgi:hypothetical protein
MGDVIYIDFSQHRPKPEPAPIKQVKSKPAAKPKAKAKTKGATPPPCGLYHRLKCAFIDRIEAYMY